MNIVFVGYAVPGSRTRQRIAAFRDLGHSVDLIDTAPQGRTYEAAPGIARRIRHRLRRPADETGANRRLRERGRTADLIWLDNAGVVRPETLAAVGRGDGPKTVWYSEDDLMRPQNETAWFGRCLPLFDLCVTTKSFNADPRELPARGARRVLFTNNAFSPEIHRPVPADDDARRRLGAAISFIGSYEAPRARSLLALARAGLTVRVWGNGWDRLAGAHDRLRVEGRPLYDDDYARAVAATDVNLCFLRKANRDRQTTRSIELPACGAFMLHEYSDEMAALLDPDREAAYFADDEELVAACRRWIADPDGRRAVADAGYRKVHAAGLRHRDVLERALAAAFASPGS
jgi:spore maturation protein CgeB